MFLVIFFSFFFFVFLIICILLLLFAFCFLPFAFCLLPFAFTLRPQRRRTLRLVQSLRTSGKDFIGPKVGIETGTPRFIFTPILLQFGIQIATVVKIECHVGSLIPLGSSSSSSSEVVIGRRSRRRRRGSTPISVQSDYDLCNVLEIELARLCLQPFLLRSDGLDTIVKDFVVDLFAKFWRRDDFPFRRQRSFLVVEQTWRPPSFFNAKLRRQWEFRFLP